MENQLNETKKQTKQFLKELSPDDKHQIWKKGFESGQEHSNPSPETRERLAILETELKNIKDLILDLSQDFKDSFGRLPCETHNKSIRTIENKINYDKGVFATIMIFVGIASTVIAGVILGFLTKVFKF